jgi:Ca2+-binding RTX toxin-like protein
MTKSKTSILQLLMLAIILGTGAGIVFTPSPIHQFQKRQSTVMADSRAGEPDEVSIVAVESDNPSLPAFMPQGLALMIPGSCGTPGDSAHSNSALAAGLPPASQFAYQAAVSRKLASVAGRGAGGGPVRTQGTGNRFTQAEIDAMKAGVVEVLTDIEDALVAEVLGEQLPIVGDGFQTAWVNNANDFRHLTLVRTAIVTALNGFTGSADYDPVAVSTAIRNQLNFFHASTSITGSTPGDGARIDFVTRRDYGGTNVPVASDFGFPTLGLQRLGTTNVSTSSSTSLNFAIGVDADGFYLETQNSVFQLNTTTQGNGINTTARLAKLEHTVTNNAGVVTAMTANFNILLKDPGGDGKIRVAELAGMPDLLDATLTGTSRLALKLDSTTPTNIMFPRVGTDLTLQWNFNAAVVDPYDDNAAFGEKPVLTLNNNRIAVETFLRGFAKNVLDKINEITAPVTPVIDVLGAPIPLLSDLGSQDVTLLDIFDLPQETKDAVNSLQRISDLAGLAQSVALGGSPTVDMGDWSMAAHDPRSDTPEDLVGAPTRPPSTSRPAPLTTFLNSASQIEGLDFPLLEDGKAVVDVLLGKNASLFTYRSGEISVTEEFSQYFPVLGPVGITLGGEIGFKAEFGFGYDTQGLFDYFAGGGTDLSVLANGFYAMALDEVGDPLTGVSLTGAFIAGVEFNLIVASVGVEGRIGATIGLYLDDQIGDEFGRIRAADFAANSIDDWFYASGRLWAGVSAYLRVGFPPIGLEFEIESPEITLLSFDSRPDETPVLAEGDFFAPGTLHLNLGDRSHLRIHGDLDDRAESFELFEVGGDLRVVAFGASNTFDMPSLVVGSSNLRGDTISLAENVPVPAHLSGGPGPDILRGGSGNDILTGGEGMDRLTGRDGDDHLIGGEDDDQLNGGNGADIFDGGLGEDTASWSGASVALSMDLRTNTFGGAAANDTLLSIERYKGTEHNDTMHGSESADAMLHGGSGDDFIRGHGGADLLIGGPGVDDIEGGSGDDFVNGGPDADTLDGGPGVDTLSYLPSDAPIPFFGEETTPVTISLLTGLGTRGDAAGDVVSNFENLIGSDLPSKGGPPSQSGDILAGDNLPNTIYGMDGTDEIRGHDGNDILYGNHPDSPLSKLPGYDEDSIFGGGGNDTLYGHGDDDLLDGENGTDTLYGGTGDDHLRDYDPASPDHLDGEQGYDRLSADFSSKTEAIHFTVGQSNTRSFANGDSWQDIESLGELLTGAGDDVIMLSSGFEPVKFNKTIHTGAGNDLVVADFRGAYGVNGSLGRTQDNLNGGDGIDTISFEQASEGVIVDFTGHFAGLGYPRLGGAASGLTISGFENIVGTNRVDLLAGDAGDNVFTPLQGTNPFEVNLDQIYGLGGIDTLVVDYSQDPLANIHGMAMGTSSGSSGTISVKTIGGRHLYSSIEQFHITGSDGPDNFYGELLASRNDIFLGRGGNDVIYGRFGADFIDGGEGNDQLYGESGNDTIYGGPGNDHIELGLADSPSPGYGIDLGEGGPGNDFVSLHYNPGFDNTYAIASDVMKLDGGEGYDTLTIDMGHVTTGVHWNEASPSDFTLPNGGYARNFERVRDINTGSGNDVIICTGRYDNKISVRGGDDFVNPGLGNDILNDAPGGYDILVLDYSQGDDPDLGGASNVSQGSPITRRRISDNAIIDSINTFSNVFIFERFEFTGGSKNDVIYGTSGVNYFYGNGGNDTFHGMNNNDWLDGGPGADSLNGNYGDDIYIVDNPGDQVIEPNFGYWWTAGNDTVRSSVNFTLSFGVEILQLTGNAIAGTGNELANGITGNTRNNLLSGGAGNDSLNGGGGAREIDTLTGGADADTFFLGLLGGRFYDDGNPSTPGHDGYALITDFTPSQNDRLRLAGAASQYRLGVSPFNPDDDALYHDSNGNGTLDPAIDELIAILQSTETLTTANTITNASYQNSVAPSVVGLTAAPVASVTQGASGPQLSAGFSILETPPSNVRIDILASNDLGIDDPWTVIARKTGSGAWTGPAQVTVSPPSGGRVSVSVADIPQSPRPTKRFMAIRLVPL